MGLYISLNQGASWNRFKNNMPPVAVHDMVIHPREDALVMATHGRGIIIIDDITPLRQLTPEVMAKPVHFFEVKPTFIREPGAGGGWYNGANEFTAPNPPSGAQIVYYMSKRHTFGKLYFEVYDSKGEKIKELPAGKSAGVNIVSFPVYLPPPKSAPTNNTEALFGGLFGPGIPAGQYNARLIRGKEEYATTITLKYDTASPYSAADRDEQRLLTWRLFRLSERLAFVYVSLDDIVRQCETKARDVPKLAKKLEAYRAAVDFYKETLVAMGGDGYVDQDERLRERISAMYGKVSSYPGKPGQAQADQTTLLEKEMEKVNTAYLDYTVTRLGSINAALKKAGAEEIKLMKEEDFLSRE
jgi:hypothetical protein